MVKSGWSLRLVVWCAVAGAVFASAPTPAAADLSAFVAAVGFDEKANLDGGVGAGVRWGKSSGIIGGETSLLIARPEREVGAAKGSATAFFYEGRFLVNLPLAPVKPFIGIGYGAITITSTDLATDLEVPDDKAEAAVKALETLDALGDLQTNQALSYGAGARYALHERLDARVDLRQYRVFSVKGIIVEQAAQQAGLPPALEAYLPPKEKTVLYNELSAGVVFRF